MFQRSHEKLSEASHVILEQIESGQNRQEQIRLAQVDVHASLLANLRELRRDRMLFTSHNKKLLFATNDIEKKLGE